MPASSDITSYDDEIGSIGKPNDVETAGGGRIVIYADAVTFKGDGAKIQANARPYSDWKARKYSLQGGSAGYIYVRTLNTVKQNSISDNSRIEAQGGYASGEGVTSGSGGVVIFDGGFDVPQNRVITNGGVASVESENGCANGASGTVFRVE